MAGSNCNDYAWNSLQVRSEVGKVKVAGLVDGGFPGMRVLLGVHR